ncbi:MAG: 3-phosphoshikimate 1-carboxyvinyltransferase [Candidatus Omnitrophica bacterium]|nr:3-phosphoshikimate 1-carboxyvinyltransferase [Candidatus Omnitrophota bacterium]
MDAIIRPASAIRGTLTLPADKAICHRAALLCALTDGPTELSPWSTAEDCRRTLELVKALGVPVEPIDGGQGSTLSGNERVTAAPHGMRIQGVGLDGLRRPTGPLECGESGTTMRLAAGLLAGQPFESVLNASGSLCRRPMKRIIEPLRQMGARLDGRAQHGDVTPPLTMTGQRPLRALAYTLPVASAQVKSAVLLAALFADAPTTVIEPAVTRDHTERLLTRLGVSLRRQGTAITVEPPARLIAPGRLTIPADPSSAAFFIAAATLVPGSQLRLHHVGLNPTRIPFLHVLKRMGASAEWTAQEEAWEPLGTVTASFTRLRGTTVHADEVPSLIDELPILMVAACLAEGETRFEGLQELKVKETDRLGSMTAGLAALGARIQVEGATVRIRQGALRGAVVESAGDHRTAMSLAVAGLLAEGETRIREVDCVKKSLGEFFGLLASVAGGASVVKIIDKA